MSKIERFQDAIAELFAGRLGVGEAVAELVGFEFELRRFGGEGGFVDVAGEVAVEEAGLYLGDFGGAFAEGTVEFFLDAGLVVAHQGEALAEPVAALVVGDAEGGEVIGDGGFEFVLTPADDGVVGVGVEVAAAVVNVLVDFAGFHCATDLFADDAVAAVGAGEHATGEVVVGVADSAVLSLQQVLALFEGFQVDDGFVFAGVGLASECDHSYIEAIVEDVGDGGSVESWVAGLVGVAFAFHRVGDLFEGVHAGGVEFEDALDGDGVDVVRLDGFVFVADVEVAVGGGTGGPALSDFFFDALEDFGAEVVAVVLCDCGHDVEGECAGGTGAELIFDEGEFYIAGVFEFLQTHGVAHVAAGAVELVGEDEVEF